jgi:hypothetical protein
MNSLATLNCTIGDSCCGKKEHIHKENGDCFICYENKSSVIYYPCLHTGMCEFCGFRSFIQNSRCPLCREEVESIIAYDVAEESSGSGIPDEECDGLNRPE